MRVEKRITAIRLLQMVKDDPKFAKRMGITIGCDKSKKNKKR